MSQTPDSGVLTELLSRNIITNQQAQEALDKSEQNNLSPVRVLLDERVLSEEKMYEVVAEAAGMRYVNPSELIVDPSASDRLTGERARRLKALPYGWEAEALLVAVADPTNVNMLDDLRTLTGAKPALVLAPPQALERKITQNYRAESEMDDLTTSIGGDDDFEDSQDLTGGEDLPIIRYVNLLIQQAIADRASDIHLEPTNDSIHVRYRIDGVLQPQQDSARNILNAVVSRIKIMANLDIAEKRVPQDGRISLTIEGRKVDLRVSTLPTVYGEKIVMRILDNDATPLNLDDIGLSERHKEIYARIAKQPYGLILATGPTGSGKTTTLYATINTVRSEAVNIITVEDPVEFRIPGLNQVQIEPKAGLHFSTALRSILRSDPDIVLVGEIRDSETAKIAVEASLTGHQVLTTLHTNDAPSAVTRLVEMGIEPYLVGQAVSLVVAQRLVRKLCSDCAQEYTPEREELDLIGFPLPTSGELPTVKKAVGCPRCANTGYRGRMALHELLEVTEDIEKLIVDGKYNTEIRKHAQENAGMATIRDDGWAKVQAGITTIDEVLRVSV